MHIETLKTFCDLAELLSFSKTAEKHFISQSAVSQQLAQLELMHKCQLVNRSKRPIELTREGQMLYEAAKNILDRYEKLKRDLSSLAASATSKVNVGAIFSIGMHTLSDYEKRFMVEYPNVNIHIEYLEPGKIYEQVLSGDLDIGIVAVPKRDRRLDVYDFQDEPLVLTCSPKHSLANESEVDIHKVQFERFISFTRGVPTREWIDSIFERYNIIVRPVMEFDNIETIKRAVEINSGISILPETAILSEIGSGTIKAITFSNENFVRPTGVIVLKDKILSRAARYFIELLTKKSE